VLAEKWKPPLGHGRYFEVLCVLSSSAAPIPAASAKPCTLQHETRRRQVTRLSLAPFFRSCLLPVRSCPFPDLPPASFIVPLIPPHPFSSFLPPSQSFENRRRKPSLPVLLARKSETKSEGRSLSCRSKYQYAT
jgi:hypothetical protein